MNLKEIIINALAFLTFPLIFWQSATGQITPLIEFEGPVRVYDLIEVDAESILLKNLGSSNDDFGIKWAEDHSPVFGLIYDGQGSGGSNRLHLREYNGDASDILTFEVNGNLGIDINDPAARLHLGSGDIRVDEGSIILSNLGTTDSNLGLIWREDENPAFGMVYNGEGSGGENRLHLREFIGSSSSDILTIKANGNLGINADNPLSTLEVNGRVNVADDVNLAQAGDIRFNAATTDFEGYDGSIWRSLTGKSKEYTINLGAAEFVNASPTTDNEIDKETGQLTDWLPSVTRMFMCPIHLPEGSKITSVSYNFQNLSPTEEMKFELRKFVQAGNSKSSFYAFASTSPSSGGFEVVTLDQDHVIDTNAYYSFLIKVKDEVLHQVMGVQVKYQLP